MRRIRTLAHEDQLAPFRRTDPFCLPSALHGEARFAWVQHLWRAGLFATDAEWERDGAAGYPLTEAGFHAGPEAVAVEGVVHWPHDGHRLVVGAPGTGKFTAAIAPLLLEDDGANAVVIDPKGGEAFRHCGWFRQGLADADGEQGVRCLDPCGLFADLIDSESLNPLDLLRPNRLNIVSDVQKLVDALVVTSGHEREPIWAMSAKKALLALLLHVVTRRQEAGGPRATLMDVQRIVAGGVDREILTAMIANPAADGLIERAALEIADWQVAEGTWRGIKLQIDASFAFLDNLGVRNTLRSTSFDLGALRQQRQSLFLVLPNKEKEPLGRWLRLMYTTVIDALEAQRGRPVHVVVDEFAALGKFERIPSDLATLRSAGLRLHIAVQDLNQLSEHYGHGWQTILGNCAVRQFLGVNDNFTADYVSQALGQTTCHDGDDLQHVFADHPPVRRPRFVGRPLMTPAEVLAMARPDMVIFADRCPRPIRLPKSPYHDSPRWAERAVDLESLRPDDA